MDVNPLRDGLRIEPSPGPTTIVIFGASGDLTRRKLLPALYRLSGEQRLPPRFSVLGIARTGMDDDGFRKQFREAVVDDFGRVEIFEIAVLVGDRAAWAQPAQLYAGAGRGGAGQDRR